jgi:integrase
MAVNRGSRHKPKWSGYAKYKGLRKWIGTFDNMEDYRAAKEQCLAELREQAANPSRQKVPTVLEFADAEMHENGKITMTWPDGQLAQKETGRRGSTVRRAREGLKPFIREFHNRPLDSFSRDEAVTWTRPKGANTQQAVRQFFNHALDRELIPRNQFTRLGASKRKRRVDRPDFEIITDEQYERLCRCARESRADDYGLVLEGAVLTEGETAIRPGEIFGLHEPELHVAEGLIHIRRQLDLDTGKITWPKDDDGHWIPMSPRLKAHLERMPRMGKIVDPELGRIVFPAPRGGYMFRSTWHTHWHSIRASAGMPDQDFYELKHRAIQWMVDPVEDGGLGLDHATVAEIIGHDDGGYLIATVYTKLGQRRAIARAQRAMAAYQERQVAADKRSHLQVVGSA